MLRAPARISQRWKSAMGSLARRAWPAPPDGPLGRDGPLDGEWPLGRDGPLDGG
jgi:hypothetical protein